MTQKPAADKQKEPLTPQEIQERLSTLPDWKHVDKYLLRVKTFPSYKDALDYVYAVGMTAEKFNHHPDIVMNFKRVEVRYWTHTARGLSALDFKLAAEVEALLKKIPTPSVSS
ncbi:MAG: putative pterin-4-alpha-carbinolamine dehydratase [Elusimicrobia bacterium]|nr:putative pterin-4-alpha-carbinolamine dehydratase [Elusimicrobiota bacterium]